MKRFLAAVVVLACLSQAQAARIPLPPAAPEAIRGSELDGPLAQGEPRFLFPDRTQAQAAPAATPPQQVSAVAPGAPPGTPIVVNAAPVSGFAEILSAIQAAFAALIAAFLGKMAIKPAAPNLGMLVHGISGEAILAPAAVAPADAATIVASIFHPGGTSIIANPGTRAAVDAALLGIVQSGVPGTAIQAAAGLIPGVSPFASILEPLLRKVVVSELSRGGAAGAIDPAATVSMPAGQLSGLEAVLKDLSSKLPFLAPKVA